MTYAALTFAVLLPVGALATVVLARRGRRCLAAAAVTVAVLVVLTAVFDNVIVGTGIVAYDPARISGIRVGVAPVEDFGYAVVAGLALPAIWELLHRRPA